MARRFFYSGDMSIEHGGYFYCLDTWAHGYVDAFRVTPCSDAGAQDNVFWLESLTVILREGTDLQCALDYIGVDALQGFARSARRHVIVSALVAYGSYDVWSTIAAQVGPDDPFYVGRDPVRPDVRLRASVDLHKLARRMARGFEMTDCVKPLKGAPCSR